LLDEAMSNRGDLEAAGLGVQMAKHAQRVAEAGLYPTLAAIGDYTYASPNQRVFPPTSAFTGTWDVGVQLSFDIGGVPAAAARTKAAAAELRKAEMERNKQQSAVTLDVQKSALSLLRAQTDLRLIRATVDQATEGLRVVQQKFDNGAAKHTDVLEAELSLLKAQFGVTNGEIGVQIAAADLARSVSMPVR
ncbi:MAG TPA: TolC family protein, partial [Spirochaetia bacterium]|nr:TolC family protein [Spirochaetia bacterium]